MHPSPSLASPPLCGVFGGSGFYQFLDEVREITVETPFGAPSDSIALGTLEGREVAFLPRHGRRHHHPAHAVNYRANVWALHSLGVRRIIAPCAVGSLQPDIHPGDFVLLDQFVDRTRSRRDTFFDGPETLHIGAAEPYCPRLRAVALQAAGDLGIPIHPTGTIVVIQGPRFSTRAESEFFTRQGWRTVGMTQYPEAILARELGICYTGIALVTDYDVGVAGDLARPTVSVEDVLAVMRDNVSRVGDLIRAMIGGMTEERSCDCEAEARAARLDG